MEKFIFTLEELGGVVLEILKRISDRKKIMLYGEIGSGKTTFTKQICKSLAVRETTSSPTFAIINEYSYLDTQSHSIRPFFHIDLYRLKNIEEVLDIGIEEYLYCDDYCLVEWPELIEPLFPDNWVELRFKILSDKLREVEILLN